MAAWSDFRGTGIQHSGQGSLNVGRDLVIGASGIDRDRDNHCLADLRVTDPRRDKERIEQAKGGLLKDAYCWILSNEDFKRWQTEKASRLLWIKGDPGKGKTMLLCGIINELMESNPADGNITYFFCQAADVRLNSATSLLRGLIYLLVKNQPLLIRHVRKDWDDAGKQLFEDVNAWKALSDILCNMLEDPVMQQAYLIIDALDECTKEVDLLLDLLVRKSATIPHVKWVVSSRNWPDIEEHLDAADRKVTICLELNTRSISTAVDTYVQYKVDELTRRKKYTAETRDTVRKYLSLNAKDTFLWVALVCQELVGISRWDACESIKQFPPDLNHFYTLMMDRIGDSKWATLCKHILEILSVAYRPVTLCELAPLVDMPNDISHDFESVKDMIRLSGSFLTIREPEQTIHFVHQSANDYLLMILSDDIFPSGVGMVHYLIFKRSLVLMHDILRRDLYDLREPGIYTEDIKPPDPDPLGPARYSCLYWIDHLHEANKHKMIGCPKDQMNEGLIHCFLKQKYLYWLEALSIMGNMPQVVLALSKLYALVDRNEKQLSGLILDARRFIVRHQSVIEQAPLQTYASALVFSPYRSLVRRVFEKDRLEWIVQQPDMEDKWDPCLLTIQSQMPLVGRITSIEWSKDSAFVASVTSFRDLEIWDAVTGRSILTLQFHARRVSSIAWSSNSSLLAFSPTEGSIEVRDTETGRCISTFQSHGSAFGDAAWSPDSAQIAFSLVTSIKIWDPILGGCNTIRDNDSHADGRKLFSIAWSYDGSLIASIASSSVHDNVADNALVKIWNIATSSSISTLELSHFMKGGMAWSEKSELYVLENDRAVRVWDLAAGWHDPTFLNDWTFRDVKTSCVAWSPNLAFLARGFMDGFIEIWDRVTGQCKSRLECHDTKVDCIAWAPNSYMLASTGLGGIVKIWDSLDGRLGSQAFVSYDHPDEVTRLVWSSDMALFASESKTALKIWHREMGCCLGTFNVRARSWSNDMSSLALLSGETIQIWSRSTNEYDTTLQSFHNWIEDVAWSYDSSMFAMVGKDMVKIWDRVGNRQIATMRCWPSFSKAVWSPDSMLLALVWHGFVKLWDRANESLFWICDHVDRGECGAIAWSYDSNWLAFGNGGDRYIRAWDRASRSLTIMQEWQDRDVTDECIAWSPDSTLFASSSISSLFSNSIIKVWNPLDGCCMFVITSELKVKSLRFDWKEPLVLHTDIGAFRLQNHDSLTSSASRSPHPDSAGTLLQPPHGYSFTTDGTWITHRGRKLLRIPPQYRLACSAIFQSTVVLGCLSGRVLYFKFRDEPLAGLTTDGGDEV